MRLPSALAPIILLAATSSYATDNVKLLGLDYRDLDPEAGPPIGVAFKDSEVRAK